MKIIARRNRADYMRARRKNMKTFSAEVEKEKFEKFEARLGEKNTTKTQWLNEKIDDELKK